MNRMFSLIILTSVAFSLSLPSTLLAEDQVKAGREASETGTLAWAD